MDLIAVQWGRFMWWLAQGQNAAAVQALVAIFTGLLTIVLVVVTWLYVRLTSHLTRLAGRQLEASLQPSLVFDIAPDMAPGSLYISISNKGAHPVYLLKVMAHISYECDAEIISSDASDISELKKVVLPAGDKAMIQHHIPLSPKPTAGEGYHNAVMHVDCTDLFGIKRHQFLYQTLTGLTQYYAHPFEIAAKMRYVPFRYKLRYMFHKLFSSR